MSRRRRGGPNALEQQLLRMCFLPPDEAVAVWDRELARSLSIADLPVAAHGLLPLLHRRLVELDRRAPDMDRLQGVRRRLWVQNEHRLQTVRTAIDQLEAVGVPVALLGGLAILVGHLGRTDLRPLHDADLLVRATDSAAAREALERNGWRIAPPWRGGYLLDLHGIRCTDSHGRSVSVRWSASPPYDDAIEHAVPSSLDHAVPSSLDHAPVIVGSPADLLLHTVLDGPPEHWAADVLTLLASDAPPDWDRLAASAAARRGNVALADALAVLDRIVPLRLPSGADAALSPSSRSPRRLAMHRTGRPTVLRAYARRAAGSGPWQVLRGVPSYLSEVWEVPTAAQLPREVARRARLRLVGRR